MDLSIFLLKKTHKMDENISESGGEDLTASTQSLNGESSIYTVLLLILKMLSFFDFYTVRK